MNVWDKQEWIKDILTKSGTDIKEVPSSNDIRKMVYYTALPLIMQNDNGQSTQICFNQQNSDGVTVASSSPSSSSSSSSSSSTTFQQHQREIVNLSNNISNNNVMSVQSEQHNQQQHFNNNFQLINQQQLNQNKFKCDECHLTFGSKSAHTSHMKSHGKQFQNQSAKMVVSNGSGSPSNSGNTNSISSDPYQCDVCKKTFAVPARLVRHYRTHTGERPFECEFCHKMFSVKENLQVHRRIHTKERPYKCEVCGRAFEHSGKLHRHMRIHTGERPHKCTVCGKTFIQSGQLVIHMRTHTGEKPYKCPVEGCGKGFTCSKQLKVHSRTHTGEKPYHCDICDRDFGYNHVLKLHRVQHYGSKCYKCTICDETFKSKKEMEAHIKGHANEMPDEDVDTVIVNSNSNSNGSTEMKPSTSTAFMNSNNIDVVQNSHHNDIGNDSMDIMNHSGYRDNILLINDNDSNDLSRITTKCESPLTIVDEEDNGEGKVTYYNMYSRFEQSVVNNYGVNSGVNPALLAAASIAAAATAASFDEPQRPNSNNNSMSPPLSNTTSANIVLQTIYNNNISSSNNNNSNINPVLKTGIQHNSGQNTFNYEPLAIMRQNYCAPTTQTTEFRPSENSNDLVRRVEAALAGTETLLTPPRSSPESPDRSSSPESDSVLMADRDNNTLPPRKRKLYFKDSPNNDKILSNGDGSAGDTTAGGNGSGSNVRMSSVIQFAKAS